MRSTLHGIAFLCLATWWVLFAIWNPGTVHLLQVIAFRFEPPHVHQDVIGPATERAFQYSTVGGKQTDDVFFTPNEVSHLEDVSGVYQHIRLVSGVAALIALAALLFELSKNRVTAVSFRRGAVFCTIAVGLLLIGLLAFGVFFIAFHEVFFPQGNWMFPDDSLLLALFPETFWKLGLGALLVGHGLFAVVYSAIASHWYERT